MSACRVATLVLLAILCAGCRLPSLDQMLDQSEPMDANRMLIGKVQGSGAASPMLKDEVIIEGVVLRSLMGDADDLAQEAGETLGEGNRGKVVGWFVQDEGDGDAATSDALFVMDQGYDTSINMPYEGDYSMRLGSRVRTGDRVQVRGVVAELLQEAAADQPRSSGHRVGRGDPAGTVTAVLAQSVTLLGPHDRKLAITPESVAMERAGDEAVEGMYLQTDGSAQPQ